MRVINVYAPSVPAERRGFFELISPLLVSNRQLVLGSDFNVALERALGDALGRLMGGALLWDTFKRAGDITAGYTWGNSRGVESRLDYFFVLAGTGVLGFEIVPVWWSDHRLIKVQVEVQGGHGERGPWCMNVSVLEDLAFCSAMDTLLQGWMEMRDAYGSWGSGGRQVARFCGMWGRQKARERRQDVASWSRELRGLWRMVERLSPEGRERVCVLLREAYEGEARRALLPVGARDLVAG